MTDQQHGIDESRHAGSSPTGERTGQKRGRDNEPSSETSRKRSRVEDDRLMTRFADKVLQTPKQVSMTNMREVRKVRGTMTHLSKDQLDVQFHQTPSGVNTWTARPKDMPTGTNFVVRGPDGLGSVMKIGTTKTEVDNAAKFLSSEILDRDAAVYITWREEDPLMTAKDMFNYNKNKLLLPRARSEFSRPRGRSTRPSSYSRAPTSGCANCGRPGHELRDCWVPSSIAKGDIYGCPLCNEQHQFDTCDKSSSLSAEQLFKVLILDRAGKCRIRTIIPWIRVLEEQEKLWSQVTMLPLSAEFVRRMFTSSNFDKNNATESWDRFKNGVQDPATKDPATTLENFKNGILAHEMFIPSSVMKANGKDTGDVLDIADIEDEIVDSLMAGDTSNTVYLSANLGAHQRVSEVQNENLVSESENTGQNTGTDAATNAAQVFTQNVDPTSVPLPASSFAEDMDLEKNEEIQSPRSVKGQGGRRKSRRNPKPVSIENDDADEKSSGSELSSSDDDVENEKYLKQIRRIRIEGPTGTISRVASPDPAQGL
ncbi:hypothetical protein UCRPA7_1399 [Phaeoacremonium minimum UCRPA7]|uniref:CCHC-type domain-containing protein n=1 Tax=Phaeoacremonium minimum (strain UCR-PA7) TaxID=1286976 RepID=R8BUP9_PHAM7|nr:hypothetical protein UCRPA7_1399 [Phaeoacremonium minimum UCRPA7]EOO03087.1 hypothetical protein UCRPA7_1399 [Phaeoacremonium minimum UCRPA7]